MPGTDLELSPSGTPGRLLVYASTVSHQTSVDPGRHVSQPPKTLITKEPQQTLIPSRRGGDSEQFSCDMLASMGSPSMTGDSDSDRSETPGEGLSAFVARVLDQLALSAWLPAAFLTAGTAILLEFRSQKSASTLKAVGKLTTNPVQVLVIIIPLLVIATVVTQAFSFEFIRALEGYWPRRGPIGLIARAMTYRQIRKKKAITKRRRDESANAFQVALPRIILSSKNLTGRIAQAVEAQLSGEDPDTDNLQGTELEVFVETIQTWRDEADAWRLARIDRLLAEQGSYPVDSRIMPTKLGNLLRATEDDLQNTGGDVRSFVLRQRNTVAKRVQMQHDQFRTRLDMYCTLFFVSLFLVALTPLTLLGRVSALSVAATATVFVAMTTASYLAALSSASGYCTALRQMDEASRITTQT